MRPCWSEILLTAKETWTGTRLRLRVRLLCSRVFIIGLEPAQAALNSRSRLSVLVRLLGNAFHVTDPAKGKGAIHRAIGDGINFFDSSALYGVTLPKERLGEAPVGKR